ncbi:MAG: TetR/AcrR family transcriptional regulator [Flavobacteriales bacterium]|jgi:AcrR family transcriptional regulator|tara:strand:- start:318 stop:989 length:672 start_codon:yes stop_codon:yes gene_type:complete
MKTLNIQIEVGSELYIKDPNSSELGRKIISKSIEMINEIGFEAFTFKKLGCLIQSNESSIYRYFDSKHSLLIYLTSWYWTWTECRIVFATTNVSDPIDRLRKAILILTKPVLEDTSISHVNEVLLSQIIFSESLKTFHTKKVDEENKKGCFKAYKSVVQRVSSIMLEITPNFQFSHMLTSTVIEGAHQQKYFADHLPSLTDMSNEEDAISSFYLELVFNFLKP